MPRRNSKTNSFRNRRAEFRGTVNLTKEHCKMMMMMMVIAIIIFYTFIKARNINPTPIAGPPRNHKLLLPKYNKSSGNWKVPF
jgi:hypothetical protein